MIAKEVYLLKEIKIDCVSNTMCCCWGFGSDAGPTLDRL